MMKPTLQTHSQRTGGRCTLHRDSVCEKSTWIPLASRCCLFAAAPAQFFLNALNVVQMSGAWMSVHYVRLCERRTHSVCVEACVCALRKYQLPALTSTLKRIYCTHAQTASSNGQRPHRLTTLWFNRSTFVEMNTAPRPLRPAWSRISTQIMNIQMHNKHRRRRRRPTRIGDEVQRAARIAHWKRLELEPEQQKKGVAEKVRTTYRVEYTIHVYISFRPASVCLFDDCNEFAWRA